MKLIYNNFDGLDVAFKCAFPEEVLLALSEAKERAKLIKDKNKGEVISLGIVPRIIKVAPTGDRGGYAFRFDTGPDGGTWFVKNSTNAYEWNVRVSLKSLNLALNGYEKARDGLMEELANFNVTSNITTQEGEMLPPEASVGRVDYCFDFATEDFAPLPEHFVVHSQTTVRGIEPLTAQSIWRGNKLETLMIGKMPNRQVEIYDKTIEIIKSNKPYWWDIWSIKKENFAGKIWRVEVRAGKEELRSWGVNDFFSFEYCLGDVLQKILTDIRYVLPSQDCNRSRWPLHPMWECCQETARQSLAPYTSNAERKKVIRDLRENLLARAQKNFRGAVATYNHLLGLGPDDILKTMDVISEDVQRYSKDRATEFRRKLRKAEDKYVFLDDGEI